MTADEMLTKEQLAQRLGFSTRQLDYSVRHEGFPPGARRGRHLKWHVSVADAWEAKVFAEQLAWAKRIKEESAR